MACAGLLAGRTPRGAREGSGGYGEDHAGRLDDATIVVATGARRFAGAVAEIRGSLREGGVALVFSSQRSGSQERTADADGGEIKRLTYFHGPPAGSASYSPDGTAIVSIVSSRGSQDVFVLDVRNGHIHRVTDHEGSDIVPSWSADGRWIYFVSRRSGSDQIWKGAIGRGRARAGHAPPSPLTRKTLPSAATGDAQ